MITVFQFRNRFNTTEKRMIELGSLHNPAAPIEVQAAAADLRVAMTDLLASGATDLTFRVTVEGVRQLVQFGLLAPERFFEILDADPDGGAMDVVVLKADHKTQDGRYATVANGEYGPDDLVEVYLVGDETKTGVGAFTARHIATGA